MWAEIGQMFADFGWFAAVTIIVGLILIIIEIFEPGFGVFGITGAILVIVGIAYKGYTYGGENPIVVVCLLIAIVGIVVLIALAIMMVSMRKGKLSRTGFVSKSKAVDEGITKGTDDYTPLIGKEALVQSDLKPCGSAEIEGKIYDVVADRGFIEKGKVVKVIAVEGIKITVKEQNIVEDK